MDRTFDTYQNLSVEELLQDDYFIESVLLPDAVSEAFWENLRIQFPLQAEKVEEATKLLHSLQFAPQLPPSGTEDRLWQSILRQSAEAETPVLPIHTSTTTTESQETISVKEPQHNKWWQWIAAAAVVLPLGYFFLVKPGAGNKADEIQWTTVRTEFGERKTLTLPDSTEIAMNANTEIRYASQWAAEKPREVWVNGEAFFDVKHVASGNAQAYDTFKVHTQSLDIQVLGTSFNVSQRGASGAVMLKQGSVRVSKQKDPGATALLVPGEMASVENDDAQLQVSRLAPENMDSWKNGLIHFDNTPFSKVAEILEQEYGKQVLVKRPGLMETRISGQAPATNIDILLKSLSIMLDLSFTTRGDTIIIQ